MATAAASRPSRPVLSIPSCSSASPTRVKLAGGSATRSPGNSVSVSSPTSAVSSSTRSRRSCMCSSTNHPGSFRCSLHRDRKQSASPPSVGSTCSLGSKRMDSGQCARRALAPSPTAQQSLQHRRRAGGFRPRPSRLSAMSTAGERPSDNQ